MKRIKVSEETNFIGCWNLNEKSLCSEIIDLFENSTDWEYIVSKLNKVIV